jgi:hypothetical protein
MKRAPRTFPRPFVAWIVCAVSVICPVRGAAAQRQSTGTADVVSPLSLTGTYYGGGGFGGRTLDLWPDGTYRLEQWSDVLSHDDPGNQHGKSYGTWGVKASQEIGSGESSPATVTTDTSITIVLTPRDGNSRPRRLLSAPLTFYLVPWSARRYLLNEREFEPFRDAVATGDEPRGPRDWSNGGLLRVEHDRLYTQGLPQFPPRWRPLLTGIEPAPFDGAVRTAPPTNYLERLGVSAVKAIESNDLPEAQRLAEELLRRAPYANRWNRDRHLDAAHQTLGRVALRQGRREAARRHLREAGDRYRHRPMALAREILKNGNAAGSTPEDRRQDREAVLHYLDRVERSLDRSGLSESYRPTITRWRAQIKAGKVPALDLSHLTTTP